MYDPKQSKITGVALDPEQVEEMETETAPEAAAVPAAAPAAAPAAVPPAPPTDEHAGDGTEAAGSRQRFNAKRAIEALTARVLALELSNTAK